jgi:DNA-binding FadR family transcriptional regulator
MSIEPARQTLIEAATGDDLGSMNQAVRLVCNFEHELLGGRGALSGPPANTESILNRAHVSRSVRNEAVRILQSREIIRAKPGPNGGLLALPPTSEHLVDVVSQYAIYRRATPAAVQESREAVDFVRSAVPIENPGAAIVELMSQAVDRLAAWVQPQSPRPHTQRCRPRAERIAQQLASRILNSQPPTVGGEELRLGHEDGLCEQFSSCRPVIRQAIRILEAQSLVESRRGRGRGLFLACPKPGPVTRLIALWLLDRKLPLRNILDFERPLRTAVAVMAVRNMRTDSDQHILELQRKGEAAGAVTLLDVIEMEKNISWLSGNVLLDLFLRTITVYKICRGQYHQMDPGGLELYPGINGRFVQALTRRNETAIQSGCEQKNDCLAQLDLRLVPVS